MTKQIIKFGVVGILCFVVDFGLFSILEGRAGYLLANAIAFTIATLLNYYLSARYVFDSGGSKSPIAFFILSVIGLALSNCIMSRAAPVMDHSIAKILSVTIVMIYNFITRKILFETGITKMLKTNTLTNIIRLNLSREREGAV